MELVTLSTAARTGDEFTLNKLLQEKPFILSDTAMINSQENILNTSIKSEQVQISLKIARTSRHLLTLQDQDGVRPLDVASAYGFTDVVRELLVLCPSDICRLAGKDGKTAIHHAVINGRIDVVKELMEKCPGCVMDVTSFGETVLHLAVRYYKFGALKSLVQWLERVGAIDEVINWKDKEGNTVLHYAAARKQLESVELLLDITNKNALEVNARNSNGLTPTDILNIFVESSSDLLLKDLLQKAGGLGGLRSNVVVPPPSTENLPRGGADEMPMNWEELVNYFRFDWRRDSASETRSGLLVVVVLFVTVAFQAGINLPSHIFPEGKNEWHGGQVVFLAFNTFILSASMAVIHYLIDGMPFQREIVTAASSLMGSYGCSLAATGLPRRVSFLIVVIIPFVMLALRGVPEFFKKQRW